MSATGRSDSRVENDDYPTPSWAVDRLLEAVKLPGGRWLEPCAGGGGIIRAVNARRTDIVWDAVEIQRKYLPQLQPLVRSAKISDFLKTEIACQYDVQISNPFYSGAEDVIRRACAPVVVMLLRLNFLGSGDRQEWLSESMPDVYVLPDRPNFAMFVKCESRRCGYRSVRPTNSERPKCCPKCAAKVTITTSDATEYAWMIFYPNIKRSKGIVRVLRKTPLSVRKGLAA